MRARFLLPLAVFLGSCSGSDTSGPLGAIVIGDAASLEENGVRLSPAAQHLHGATREGLIALDPSGQIVPAIAERWIVTEDGLSYIFRLRDSQWPDGEPISAEGIRRLLLERLRQLEGTSLGFDLAKIDQVRAMTGRVIEIRLKSPMPEFLRLVAQPEMGLARDNAGAGPMRLAASEADGSSQAEAEGQDEAVPENVAMAAARLLAMPPEERGMPARRNWASQVRPLLLRAMPAEQAVASFTEGSSDIVLNGTLSSLPLADTGPLSAGTVRLDAPLGLFGLMVRNASGLLSGAETREALAMAIDRSDLMQPFNFGGWQSSTLVFPADLTVPNVQIPERWAGLSIEQRQEVARRRISVWRGGASDRVASVSIGLPDGPGSALLFQEIASDLAVIGVEARRAEISAGADLVLFDRLARYYSPRWYLNQFNCALDYAVCSPEADELVAQAITVRDQLVKDQLYSQAQTLLLAEQPFIPLGQPVRWSLVRGNVTGFEENQWGLHPLFPMSGATI